MPDETYSLTYTASAGTFLATTNQVEAALRAVDVQVEKVKKDIAGFASGGGRSAAAAARQVDKLAESLKGVPAAAGQASASLQGIGGSAAGAGASLGQFLGAGAALAAFHAGLAAVAQVTADLEQHWKKMAEESVAFRDSLRELANIRGEAGPNNKVLSSVLDMSVQANMIPQKALEFVNAYENVGPAVREKGHYKPTKGNAEDLEKTVVAEVGRTAQRMGIDPRAAGEAIGSAGLAHTFTSPEQAMTIYGGALKGLSEGKLSYTGGVRALNKASAKLVDPREAAGEGAAAGRIGAFNEAGVYMGVLSLGTGTADQAAHRMVQNSRALNSLKPEAQAAYKAAGITPDMTDPEKLIKLADYTKNMPDRIKWMAENKIGTEATREGMEASMKQADVLKGRLARMREGRKGDATGKEFIAANEAYMRTDRAAQANQAKVAEKVMDQVEGEKVEPLETAKAFAEQRIRAKYPEYANSWRRDLVNRGLSVLTGPSYGVGGTGAEQENAFGYGAIPTLKSEGKKVGVDVAKQFPGLNSTDYKTRAAAFGKASEAVRAKGGDPYGQREVSTEVRRRAAEMNAGQGQAGAAGGPRVQVDASEMKEATRAFKEGVAAFASAANSMKRNAGGGDLGAGYGPVRS